MAESEEERMVRHARETRKRHAKIPLGMPQKERQRLMALMLRIHEQAMIAFDCLEADMVSEHDVAVMAQLPQYVNSFVDAMKAHANRRIEAEARRG